jgi:hypothetical protein
MEEYNTNTVENSSEKDSNQEIATFDQLYVRINEIGGLQGSKKFYTAEELIGLIEGVRRGEYQISVITSTQGLNDLVSDLLAKEANDRNKDNLFINYRKDPSSMAGTGPAEVLSQDMYEKFKNR